MSGVTPSPDTEHSVNSRLQCHAVREVLLMACAKLTWVWSWLLVNTYLQSVQQTLPHHPISASAVAVETAVAAAVVYAVAVAVVAVAVVAVVAVAAVAVVYVVAVAVVAASSVDSAVMFSLTELTNANTNADLPPVAAVALQIYSITSLPLSCPRQAFSHLFSLHPSVTS